MVIQNELDPVTITYVVTFHRLNSNAKQSSETKVLERERVEMRLFDPWPVFFKREWKRCWPFLTGFAITGVLITKLTAGFTGKTLFRSDRFFYRNDRNQSLIDPYLLN